ncbi:spore germination protein [Paenibacillus psychroresistens]|uniref:Spore germination protein n=1 Tax=Paenibacillus psychroresistens TaxID=1778678 RepID=A0A6B8RPB5_9BACL|nr:spore germination protein [Paenibacillus psychroresistens]QGQ97687.1 spore germination protein [Paenibacillus psychroresistens]
MLGKIYRKKAKTTKVFLDKATSHQMDNDCLTSSLKVNETRLRVIFQDCSDVNFRSFQVCGQKNAFLLYIDGLIDEKQLEESLMKPLMSSASTEPSNSGQGLLSFLQNQLITISQVKQTADFLKIEQEILKGSVAICIDEQTAAILVSVPGGNTRSVEQPSTENTVRGSRDSFTEILRTNTSLIRRKVRSSRLKIEMLTVGDITQTEVAIVYMKGITNESTLQDIKTRIQDIQIDVVLESGYIEQLIEERSFSPFPQFLVTERPDYVVSALLQGQVVIITDGSPFAISAPMTFWGFLQAGEDYYERLIYANLIRFIRLGFTMIALLLPSLYVALTTFHQQMIPTNLLLSIAAAREGVPFPALVEAVLLEVTFEGLREAGVRLPKQIGQAVSIVGGLVVGQAAVQAGIVSAPMVIVVSLTGIASFAIPRYNFSLAFRILRFPMILLAGMFGLYGIAVGLLIILVHLSGLKSFGVPYLFPTAPVSLQGLKDALFRAPLWTLYLHQQPLGKKLKGKESG